MDAASVTETVDALVVGWPAAIAIVASVVTLTVGAIKIMSQGKAVRTVNELHAEHTQLAKRVAGVETQMVRLESDLQGTITTQIADLKGDIRRMDAKMDQLVKAALDVVKQKG